MPTKCGNCASGCGFCGVNCIQPEVNVFSQLLPGVINTLNLVCKSIANSTMLYSGEAAFYASVGIKQNLLGIVIMNLALCVFGSIPCAIAIPGVEIIPFALSVYDSVKSELTGKYSGEELSAALMSNMFMILAVESLISGIALLLIRFLKLEKIVDFLPNPVKYAY